MESIITLEELIQDNAAKVELHERQLQSHKNGERVLSAMSLASAEAHLEEAKALVEKYTAMLEQLSTLSAEELQKKEQLHTAALRKKYFDTQKSRIESNLEKDNDIKLAVLRIIGELPVDTQFKDEELFEMASKSIELTLPPLEELLSKLNEIKNDFNIMTKNLNKRDMQEFATIDFLIPIVVLHFYILSSNIKENIEEYNLKIERNQEDLMEHSSSNDMFELEESKKRVFKGFPKYEDWWLRELWSSHQAYFALYNWKSMIMNLCFTTEQKKAWSIIFDRWVFIKKLLNDKGELAYNYHFAFDSLMYKYVDLKEEMNEKKMVAIESLIKELTLKEDFTQTASFHNIKTPYYLYKFAKLNPQEEYM